MGEEQSSTDGWHQETETVVLHKINKTQNSHTHRAVVETLEKWCFFPYPSCTHKQLDQVSLFLVACSASCGEEAAARKGKMDMQEDLARTMIGVVGIVWVPLSTGAQVEGYIQVVLVQPSYRRRHIAHQLLKCALRMEEESDSCRRIARWRLHTMGVSQGTKKYLQRLVCNFLSSPVLHEVSATETQVEAVQPDAADSAALESRVEEAERLVAVVPLLYEGLGFSIRRYVYAYYDNSVDAIEMVKNVLDTRKRWKKHSDDEVLVKKNRIENNKANENGDSTHRSCSDGTSEAHPVARGC